MKCQYHYSKWHVNKMTILPAICFHSLCHFPCFLIGQVKVWLSLLAAVMRGWLTHFWDASELIGLLSKRPKGATECQDWVSSCKQWCIPCSVGTVVHGLLHCAPEHATLNYFLFFIPICLTWMLHWNSYYFFFLFSHSCYAAVVHVHIRAVHGAASAPLCLRICGAAVLGLQAPRCIGVGAVRPQCTWEKWAGKVMDSLKGALHGFKIGCF